MTEIHTPDEMYIPVVPHDPSLGDPGKDWMAIVSLVSGIFGLCIGFFLVWCGLPLSIVSIILGVLGLKSTQRVLAIIGIALGGLDPAVEPDRSAVHRQRSRTWHAGGDVQLLNCRILVKTHRQAALVGTA